MVLIGEFREEIIDEANYLVYHSVEYPSPQINGPNSSNKVVIDDLPVPPLFLCPSLRKYKVEEDQKLFKYETSPLYDGASGRHVHPLSWCSNERAEPAGECNACRYPRVITKSYYYCGECDERYHKECAESPLDIYYPSHSKLSPHFTHSFQLFLLPNTFSYCSYCDNRVKNMVYYCTLCNCYFHTICAMRRLPFHIYQKATHTCLLTIFPREASLICNVCGMVDKHNLSYVCAKCNFVIHFTCFVTLKTIRITRHEHRISFVSSLPFNEWLCKVCHKGIDCDYGAYACNLCSDYFVHTTCGLRLDLCDRIELEGVPEEEYEDVEPFERRGDGYILHFLHDHPLRLFEVISKQVVYDENKFCQACGLSIYEGNFYSCLDCNFILHEVCANAPRKRFSLVHRHKLNLELTTKPELFYCDACFRDYNGFFYACPIEGCCFERRLVFCLRCALVSEPFIYQGHQHPLFQSLDPKVKHTCHVCKTQDISRVLNCVESECGIIICFKCATLPFMVKYKHDEHYLTFHRGEEASPNSDWCELCEGKLANGSEAGFYACDHCCTTLHINCLLGPEPYLMPGKVVEVKAVGQFHVRRNNSSTRKYCITCKRRCPYPTVFVSKRGFSCSPRCAKRN